MFGKVTIEKIERETEKAVLVACEIEDSAGERKVWFPKSQIQVDESGKFLMIPAWLEAAKIADATGGRRDSGNAWFN